MLLLLPLLLPIWNESITQELIKRVEDYRISATCKPLRLRQYLEAPRMRGFELCIIVVGLLTIQQGQALLPQYTSRCVRQQHTRSTLRSTAVPSKEASSIVNEPNRKEKRNKWFPTKIQEDVDYEQVVQSLYLRHILVETTEMAQLTLSRYISQHSTASKDPFGDLAKEISACQSTRAEGGKVGWIDLEQIQTLGTKSPELTSPLLILPPDVLEQLIKLTPKSGDVHIIQSAVTDQIHVIRVEELLIRHNANLLQHDSSKATRIVGSYSGLNAVLPRSKLKGRGVLPEFPKDLQHKKYTIQTAGCQMNVADSERLAGILEQDLGLEVASKPQEADVLVFNTCSIRDHAEQKLYDILGPYCARKRKGESLALIVTGCVAQQEGEALLRRVPEIDVVLGPQYIPFLQNVFESVEWGHQVVATAPMLHQEDDSPNAFEKPIRGHNVRAWVNVIHGCNEHCTYCVVPATRGMEQSRTMEAILKECLGLAANGYKEVTLLGQNIDAYGRDMTPKRTFAELLEYLNTNLPDKFRIRYVTSHPRYFSDRVIDAVANLDKVCECFHVPFQAGDDDVLKKMRRGYTYESYMRIINKIREKAPDAAICGDVIVGFPGETEEAFQRTLDLMEEVKFDNVSPDPCRSLSSGA